MSNSPFQNLLSRRGSQVLSASQLESLGKIAASAWGEGRSKDLTDAVVTAIKTSSITLTSEQVRRVAEFANTEAYLNEFKKEGEHKIVDFGPSGPANPADVLRNLNAIGGMAVKDSGLEDYSRLPEKHSSWTDADFDSALSIKEAAAIPEVNPYSDAEVLREKLASAYALATDQISSLELMYQDLTEHLYHEVKQAAMNGTSLGEVVQAWSSVSEEPAFVKAAFDTMVPRLFDEGVFPTLDEMSASIMKTAGSRTTNVEHPLVQYYTDFCDVLTKLADLRGQQEEYRDGYDKLTCFLSMLLQKEAMTWGPLDTAERGIERGLHNIGVTGLPNLVARKGIAKVLPAALAYGAYRNVTDPYRHLIPGTDEYRMRMAQQGVMV